MRFCKTTLWIKKSSFYFKEMSFTTFGPFRTDSKGFDAAFDEIGART